MAKFFMRQGPGLKVDRSARRINGIAIATKGDANGEGFDDQTLSALVALGSAGQIRARFDHPNRMRPSEIEQTLDNLLGEHTGFRLDGDVVRADCVLAGVNLDKEEKILALAEKTPHLFGVSVVFDEAPRPKGQKPKPGDPCRPTKLYAADFVDIPASNSAGLFAARTSPAAAGDQPMDLDMYAKDGKLFCQVDGKEYALNHNAETFAATKGMLKAQKAKDSADNYDDDDDLNTDAAKKKKAATLQKTPPSPTQEKTVADAPPLTQADLDKASAQAVITERARRKMFGTILTTAGVTDPKEVEELEGFYEQGIDEKQLKFLASRTIGARAKAVGEGSGEGEKKPADKPGADPAAAVETAAGKSFDSTPEVRHMYGCRTGDPASEAFKTARGRHVASARRRFLAENPA